MNRGILLQWAIIAGILAGSFINLGMYHHKLTSKHEEGRNKNILMAALDPQQSQKKLYVNKPNSVKSNKQSVLVPLEQDDRALMVEAKLDNRHKINVILDTGATYTAISEDLANSMGYDLTNTPRIRITTANGQVFLPKIILKSVTLNGYTAHNVEATVMPLPKHVPFSGLLGLNFVKRHRITIDAKADHLLIEPPQV